jgi:hypothetical protein
VKAVRTIITVAHAATEFPCPGSVLELDIVPFLDVFQF